MVPETPEVKKDTAETGEAAGMAKKKTFVVPDKPTRLVGYIVKFNPRQPNAKGKEKGKGKASAADSATVRGGWGYLIGRDDCVDYYFQSPDETFHKSQKITFVQGKNDRGETIATRVFGLREEATPTELPAAP